MNELDTYLHPQSFRSITTTSGASNGLSLVDDDFYHHVLNSFLKEHLDNGVSVQDYVHVDISILRENTLEVIKCLQEEFDLVSIPCGSGYSGEYTILSNSETFVTFRRGNNSKLDFSALNVISESEAIAEEILDIVKSYQIANRTLSFNWIYGQHGESMEMNEVFEETVDKSLYPFISDFDTFSDRYLSSKSNILVLQGPPGTGKTTFIKHLIEMSGKQAFLTYDSEVLSNDHAFVSFIAKRAAGSFVIEDADLMLKSREDGNTMVSRFLNVGDGLIKIKGKKLIFSTNLPNLNHIDSALTRPGRCFDIISFRALTRDEALVVAEKKGLSLMPEKEEFTLAEIFNSPVAIKVTHGSSKSKFGFC